MTIRWFRPWPISLVLLGGSVNAACLNFRPPPAPLPPDVTANAPSQLWVARAGRRLTHPVAVRDGTLYGGGVDRKVYAIDLATGEVRWSSRLSGMILGGVLMSGDTIYAATGRPEGRVYAIDRATGKRLWRASVGEVGAALARSGTSIIAATDRGQVVAVGRDGRVRWRARVGVARTAVVPAGSGLIVATTRDSLFRLDSASGAVTHRGISPGTIVSPWLPLDGALVAGTTDSQIVAVRPSDLRREWQVRLDAPVLTAPAARGDTVFAVTRRGTLYRILPGEPRVAQAVTELAWPVTAPVTLADEQIWLGGADGTIRALRLDGTELWRLRVWRPVELGPVVLADGLLAVGGNGDLHRYRR